MVRIVVLQAATAALVTLVGSVFLSVMLERMAGLGSQAGGVLSDAYSDLAFALTVPMHLNVANNSATASTPLVDVWINWPIGLFSLVVLAACGMAGWRAAVLTRAGPKVALGVAFVYATIASVIIYVAGEYAQIGNALGNPLAPAPRYIPLIAIDPGQSWEHAFFWALLPALLGAGAGRGLLDFVRARWRPDLFAQWHAAVVGALWAVGACLLLCGGATLIATHEWANSSPEFSGHASAVVSGFLATVPTWSIYALAVGVGASLQASLDLGSVGASSSPSAGLLGHWPLTDWAYILPLLVIAGFLFGSRKALSLHPSRTAGFRLVAPFALLNLGLAWLAGASAHVRVGQSFLNQLTQSLGSAGPNTQNQLIAAMTGSGVGIGYGPVLWQVLLGSIAVGLIAAALLYVWLEPPPATQPETAPSPASATPAPLPHSFEASGSEPQSHQPEGQIADSTSTETNLNIAPHDPEALPDHRSPHPFE